jgi:peptidoglycan hydrolase-like protein with peptidoglycan-binding domain
MTRRILACAALALAIAVAAQAAPAAHAADGGSAAARADWSAGPVARGTGYVRPGGSERVREVQRRLARLGYATGPVDGLFGPRTEGAARRFQVRVGLQADAIVGRRTLGALRVRDDARRTAPAARSRPAPAPASPAPTRDEAPAPRPRVPAETGALSPVVSVLPALLILLAAGLVTAGLRRRAGPAALTVRADEIVAASAARELVARSEAGFPPRWSRTEVPELPAIGAASEERR